MCYVQARGSDPAARVPSEPGRQRCLSGLGIASHLIDGERAAAARARFPAMLPGNTVNSHQKMLSDRPLPSASRQSAQRPLRPEVPTPPDRRSSTVGSRGCSLLPARGCSRKVRGVLCHGTSLQIHCEWLADPGVAGRPGGRSQDCLSVAMVACARPRERAGALPPCGAPLPPAAAQVSP